MDNWNATIVQPRQSVCPCVSAMAAQYYPDHELQRPVGVSSTWADSVLLWAVMEMYGLEAVEQVDVRGGHWWRGLLIGGDAR
ncbi:hypothetical protein CesoFtcFv8_014490 [Champsocephalus esox]|uniref:Uncharacterized protein n=1 Tax=Champsocephalus esox TaxID=159716 RepID=A0AAN8BNI7_9TELE|nr:hypothetical protein CesoFtcFv8_014490 [Champsocephalus esox]